MNIHENKYLTYKKAYYAGTPLISDSEFDSYEEWLRSQYPNSSVFNLVGDHFSIYEIEHTTPMLSLDKVRSAEDLVSWACGAELSVDLKYDGKAVSLEYNWKGELALALTRGNGLAGKNVTYLCKVIPSIPKQISVTSPTTIRGEVVITKPNFELLVEEYKHLNLVPPTTLRGIASGLLNPTKKENIHLTKYLTFIPYSLTIKDQILVTERDVYNTLNTLGFQPYQNKIIKSSLEEITKIIEYYIKIKDSKKVLTDGLVFSINNINEQLNRGFTTHHPKGKISFKLESKTVTTIIEDIIPAVTRTGILSFVAKVTPVNLGGATVKRASLYNASNLQKSAIGIGDTVTITRSGEIIPVITNVLVSANNIYQLPKTCPSCNSELIWDENATNLLCVNLKCQNSIIKQIHHWIKSLNIENCGLKTIEILVTTGLISNIQDLYTELTIENISNLPGYGQTLAELIIDSLNKSKSTSLIAVLTGLGIDGLSKGTFEKLVKWNSNIANWSTVDWSNVKIPDIGTVTIATIQRELTTIQNTLAKLSNLGFTFSVPSVQTKSVNSTILILNIAITGTLSRGRKEITEDIILAGHNFSNSVKSTTNYLVCGEHSEDKNSSKYKSALNFNIPIITENELYEILKK